MGLEDGLARVAARELAVPRASLLTAPGTFAGISTRIWMGGAHSHVGEEMLAGALAASLVVDAAGDMPLELRNVTGTWVPCVFADLDSVPVMMHRIRETVERVVAATRDERAPDAVYVVCQYGMNRSGLLAGLILREMGMPGDEVITLIRAKRPGALSNRAFERLIRAGR
jgi:hypothetical protein